jgi:predicted nucleic acid-binding Zn ribbon protein
MNMSNEKYKDYSKRKKEATPLSDAFDDLLKAYRLKDTFDEKALVQAWPSIMGNTIASRTSEVYIKDKKLFAKINSGPLKQEMRMNQSKLLQLIEERFGSGIITEVVIL